MMDESTLPEKNEADLTVMSFAEFLESIPPNQQISISDLAEWQATGGFDKLCQPEIQIHCPSESCNGNRFFRCTSQSPRISEVSWGFFYLTYQCSNCQKTIKKFAIAVLKSKKDDSGLAYKLGELPPYGPPTPSRLIKLIGPDRDLFLKGRRCENQGLGVGAFAYYRRVVEDQKDRILDEIIKVAKKLNAAGEAIIELENAKKEIQFSKALSSVKSAMPQSLLINGHNPLLLLHSALSEGVHELTDEECLEIASSIRIILIELSERLAQALKDEVELNHALTRLLSKKQ